MSQNHERQPYITSYPHISWLFYSFPEYANLLITCLYSDVQPLIMSNDLRNISKEATDILLNREVIAVDQDKLGKMGRRVFAEKDLEVWSRALSNGSVAAALFNRNAGSAQEIKADFELIGLTSKTASVRDLFAREDLGQFTNFFSAKVNPSGVVMVKLSPVKDAFF